jgi:hypothetical protein
VSSLRAEEPCGRCGKRFQPRKRASTPAFCSRTCYHATLKTPRELIDCECGCGTKINNVTKWNHAARFARGHANRANGTSAKAQQEWLRRAQQAAATRGEEPPASLDESRLLSRRRAKAKLKERRLTDPVLRRRWLLRNRASKNKKANTKRVAMHGTVGCVYFIRQGAFVKIGWTRRSPMERLHDLQGASPVPLEMIGVLPDKGVGDERSLHERFAAYRTLGEWFHMEPVLSAVGPLEPAESVQGATSAAPKATGYLVYGPSVSDVDWEAVGLGSVSDVVIARQLGVSWGVVRHHRDRLGIPPFRKHKAAL